MTGPPPASRPRLVLWGTGGHARVVAEILRLQGRFEIVGALDDAGDASRAERLGLPLLGGADRLESLRREGVENLAIAIGHCEARLRRADEAARLGFRFPLAVHPSAVISAAAELGEGTVAAAGAVVNPGARIGRLVILNTASSVDHDCRIGDGAHICPGVRLAGGVEVGRAAWVGIGSVARENVTIGDGALVGAGSVVVSDLPPGIVAHGSPAREVGRAPGEGSDGSRSG